MNCPNCGHENEENDTYCSNCGERLQPRFEMPEQYTSEREEQHRQSSSTPPAAEPARSPTEDVSDDPHDPEWRMSPLPPPEPAKRRTWLWVLVGILLFCVLLVCGFGAFLTTGTGQDLMDDLATRAANAATEAP